MERLPKEVQRMGIARCFGLALILALCAQTVGAEPLQSRHGLMWNRTGLPAVFPLQVRTDAGQDYVVTLRDVQTGDAALAAYVEGGRFFRVLVPPGTFEVQFAYGQDWQGEEAAFGEEMGQITLAEPLTFAVRHFDAKGGYVLDLTDMEMSVSALDLCQSYRFAQIPFGNEDAFQVRSKEHWPDTLRFFETPLERLAAEREIDLVYPGAAPDRDRAARVPRIEVRTRPCGER